jgi:undecaprenyl diphosphate synthase
MMQHLACIMDGNRRWAKAHGLLPWYGHKEGFDAAIRIISFAQQKKIPYVSLYLFALQNFKRSQEEIDHIFTMLANQATHIVTECLTHNILVRFIGDRSLFPKTLSHSIDFIEQSTAHCTSIVVNLLFCYGGQEEIVSACQKIAEKIKSEELQPDQITSLVFENYLWSSPNPPPDLIIRTGKSSRLSNFLLYQAAYAELYFADCLWPEIDYAELEKAYIHFLNCKRNFGI